MSEQHTKISTAHTRASSSESQPPSRRVKKLHAKHVTGEAGALPPPESLLAQKRLAPKSAAPSVSPAVIPAEAKAVEDFAVSLMVVSTLHW